jgi:sigma-B regulation protein RsbU (phosphoserine phosphatase)
MPQLFMAMVAGRITDNSMELAGGGLPPALIYNSNTKTIEEIQLKGLPLGYVTKYGNRKMQMDLKKGDTLLFMTDGLPELFNSNKEMYGIEKIKNAFSKIATECPEKIIEYLNNEIDNWRKNHPLQDDITFMVLKVKN